MDRKQKDCGDYKLHRLADRPVSRAAQLSCNTCPRTLYCHRCYDNHLVLAPNGHVTDSAKTSVCAYLYSCEECRKQINLWKSRRKRQRPHKCWVYFCKTFKDRIDIDIHNCATCSLWARRKVPTILDYQLNVRVAAVHWAGRPIP